MFYLSYAYIHLFCSCLISPTNVSLVLPIFFQTSFSSPSLHLPLCPINCDLLTPFYFIFFPVFHIPILPIFLTCVFCVILPHFLCLPSTPFSPDGLSPHFCHPPLTAFQLLSTFLMSPSGHVMHAPSFFLLLSLTSHHITSWIVPFDFLFFTCHILSPLLFSPVIFILSPPLPFSKLFPFFIPPSLLSLPVPTACQKSQWLWMAETVPLLLQWRLRQDDHQHHRRGLCLPEWILGLYWKACHYAIDWQVEGQTTKGPTHTNTNIYTL